MEILKTKKLDETQFRQINELWNEEYPINLKDRFGLLLEGVDNYNHYLIEKNNQILAWAVDFEKENETRFSIIVNKKYQGKGLGSLLIDRLKKDLGEFYGWVIDHNNDKKQNGEYYTSPLLFYLNQGFEVLPDCRIDIEILHAVKIRRTIDLSLETERTFMRKLTKENAEDFYKLNSDSSVLKYTGDKPFDNVADAESFLLKYDQYQKYKVGRLAVIHKTTSEFIGWCGLKYNPDKNEYDIGFRFFKQFWNKGFATETAQKCLSFGFKELKIQTIVGRAMKENSASIKVLEKLGMTFKNTFDFDGQEGVIYELTKDDYETKNRTENNIKKP